MNRRNQDNALLQILHRGELSATDAYFCALRDEDRSGCARLWLIQSALRELEKAHHQRAKCLAAFLANRGETRLSSPSFWGWFTRVLVWLAAAFGQGSKPTARVLAVLREGEEYGLCQVRSMLPDLSEDVRRFVEREVLAAQVISLAKMTQLVKARVEAELDGSHAATV